MKSAVRISLVCLFVFALGFLQVPQAAIAASPPTQLAGGTWEYVGVEGSLVPLDLESNPDLDDMQVMDWKMLKVDKAVQVCHPFRAGQFGWFAEVRQLVAGKWVKIPTTQGMIPEVDGRYMACAALPEAGTYALFGGFSGPAGEPTEITYCGDKVTGFGINHLWGTPYPYTGYDMYIDFDYPGMEGDTVYYAIIYSDYPMSGDTYGSAVISRGRADFGAYTHYITNPLPPGFPWTYMIAFTTPTCYYYQQMYMPPPPSN